MANPLSPPNIVQSMVDALPTHPDGDGSSDLSSSYEALALFVHACMVNLGFRLLGFNEEQKIEAECTRLAPRLPPKWNASFSSYSFVYAHTQSSMTFVVKIDRLGGKAEIRGLAVGDENIHRFELTARDFVSSNALPVRIPLTPAEDRSAAGGLPENIKNAFISEPRIKDLADLLKLNIIQRILPRLQKEGYQESRTEDDHQAEDDLRDAGRRPGPDPVNPAAAQPPFLPEPARPYPINDPLAEPPREPRRPMSDFPPPDFEDPLDINRPRMGMGQPRMPFGGIGRDDLNPPNLGPHDPLRGSFVPGGGLPRPGGHGGMHPTFDDPLFRGQGRGGGEGEGFDPQMPPGARWDPVGPGFPGFGRGGSGRGGNPFGGGGSGFGGFGGGII